jgi:hypothetical protein
MSDVIEHVNSPLQAINNLAKQLAPGGCMIITTPNPTHYGLVLRAWLGRQTSVYYDHVSAFLPEHFQVMSNRLDLQVTDVVFFTHLDMRTSSNHFKSRLARLVGRVMPRSHSTFLVVLKAWQE